MSESTGPKTAKRIKRSGDAIESDDAPGAGSKRALFLKPVLAKRPWYVGGKAAFSRDGTTLYCAGQGGVVVVKNFSSIVGVAAKDDDVISFALAVSVLYHYSTSIHDKCLRC